MSDSAWKTFNDMSPAARQNLARLNVWLNPERVRLPGEWLIGPEYAELRRHGVIGDKEATPALGKGVAMTTLGRDVLYYIENPHVP